MLCIKCGHDSPEGSKYCEKCNALLPQQAPTGIPGAESSLDLSELVDYPVPETHYRSPVLEALAWAVQAVIDGEGDLDPVIENYEAFVEVFDHTREELPMAKEVFYSQRGVIEGDPFPTQLNYLITKAEEFFDAGQAKMETFFNNFEKDEAEAEELISAVASLLQCNDQMCMAIEILSGRVDAFNETIKEFQHIIKLQGGPAKEEVSVPTPVDSTDL